MCGRFALQTPRSRIASRYFDLQLPVGDVHARYKITPGTQITSVLATPEMPVSFAFSHWGFRPPSLGEGGCAQADQYPRREGGNQPVLSLRARPPALSGPG